VTEDNR